jgi:hypothetical protein
MLGRGRRHGDRFATPDGFFGARTKRKLWSCRRLSDRVLEQSEHPGIDDPPDFVRVLLVWKLTFEETRREGLSRLGDRYLLVRHEDLAAYPAAAIGAVYELIGRPPPDGVAAWAGRNVRSPEPIPFADDRRWADAAERIGLAEAVERAGCASLAATLTR